MDTNGLIYMLKNDSAWTMESSDLDVWEFFIGHIVFQWFELFHSLVNIRIQPYVQPFLVHLREYPLHLQPYPQKVVEPLKPTPTTF